MRLTIRGLQEAQAANQKLYAEVQPGSGLGRLVAFVTGGLLRYTLMIVHRITGGLASSLRIERISDATHRIFIDPSGVNPLGDRPAEYGIKEHALGGEHAFFERAVNEAGDRLTADGIRSFTSRLP